MKICIKCKIEKDEREFHKNSTKKDGLRTECKDCHCIDVRKYKHLHRKPNRYEKSHRVIAKQKYKLCTVCNQWKLETEFPKASGQKINQDGLRPECKLCRRRKRSEYVKAKNKNAQYLLNNTMRRTIWNMLKGNKNKKHWEELVGYTVNELKIHLESQFQDGMSWNNYGQWHIDHKIPSSVFNFSEKEHIDFKRCWALENLQPMWAKENIRKYSKIKEHFQPMLKLKVS